MRVADVFLPKLSLYLFFFWPFMLTVRMKETSETCPRLLGMTAAHLWPRPSPPSHWAPRPLCPPALTGVRVVCCGLRTLPDAAFPSLYLFAHKGPVKVCQGLPSCMCRNIHRFSPQQGYTSKYCLGPVPYKKVQGTQKQGQLQIIAEVTYPHSASVAHCVK